MAAVQQSSWVLSAEKRAELLPDIHEWFADHGVPQFIDRYSAKDRLRFLILSLVVLVAFEIGAAPQLPRTLVPLLVVPPVVVALMALARPILWRMLGREEEGDRTVRRPAALLLMLGILTVLLWRSDWPPAWSDAWVDFSVILVAELASMALFTRDVWIGDAERLARPRRRLIACTIGAVILFSLLLTLDQAEAVDSQQLLNGLVPGRFHVPLALPALVCMLAILTFAARMFDAAPAREGKASTAVAACFPAVPLLVLVLAAQTTFLRERHELGWARVWLPLVVAFILFILSAVGSLFLDRQDDAHTDASTDRRVAWNRIIKGAEHPLFLIVLLATSLIGFPMLVGRDLGIHAFGWSVSGGAAAALMFGIYLPYFALVCLSVWFGLDRVAVWVLREIWRDRAQIVQGITGGLPMLLVFAAFFALAAETWQVVVLTDTSNFVLLVGLLVALTLAVLVVQAVRQLRHDQKALRAWEQVCRHRERLGRSDHDRRSAAIRELLDGDPPESVELSPDLKLRMRINALLVIAIYQALVLVPVGLGALVLFWVIGRLAVPPEVAAQWIYGDNAGRAGELRLAALSFPGEPWTRVPVVLAAFAVLYLTVTLLTAEDQRTYFFSAASTALQQRLAVRIAYRLRLCGDAGEQEQAGAVAAPPPRETVDMAPAPSPEVRAGVRGRFFMAASTLVSRPVPTSIATVRPKMATPSGTCRARTRA
jgi:hypothetical protein